MSSFLPAHFLNRELSWLEFNRRVLAEAQNPSVPLLERVKFFCIFSSYLDEFFEVRVAGIKQQIASEIVERSIDGKTATEKYQIHFLNVNQLSKANLAWLNEYYLAQVRPVLTPLAIDPAHPFPQLLNKSLNMMVQVEMTLSGQPLRHLAVVQVPRGLPRLLKLPREGSAQDYVFLGPLIGYFLA